MRSIFTHERINSIIAIAGFIIALITAWKTFGPQYDELRLSSQGRLNVGPLTTIRTFPLPIFQNTNDNLLVGPIYWKTLIHNPLNRPVSIVDIEYFVLDTSGGKTFYSELNNRTLVNINSNVEIQLPFNLAEHETTAFHIGLNIPIKNLEKQTCIKQGYHLSEVEKCHFKKSIDLFGNPVKTEFHQHTDNFSITWERKDISPIFLVIFHTIDGSSFSVRLPYYPF